MSGKLPSEILRDKYVPLRDFESLHGVSREVVESLIKEKKIRYAEMKDPKGLYRIPFVNPEDVFRALGVDYNE